MTARPLRRDPEFAKFWGAEALTGIGHWRRRRLALCDLIRAAALITIPIAAVAGVLRLELLYAGSTSRRSGRCAPSPRTPRRRSIRAPQAHVLMEPPDTVA